MSVSTEEQLQEWHVGPSAGTSAGTWPAQPMVVLATTAVSAVVACSTSGAGRRHRTAWLRLQRNGGVLVLEVELMMRKSKAAYVST
jgi:hypothetical protein